MPDRTIPFYNMILKCTQYDQKHIILPDGYQIVSYQPGFEADWARMEYSAGDFENEKEAADCFCDKYLIGHSRDDILFLLEKTGSVIGSCIAWTDDRKGIPVNSLHWLIVDQNFQGKHLGRYLCESAMNRFYRRGGEPVYIHTQPWSWKAVLLYCSLGFRLQKSDSFSNYTNQYDNAMETLKTILSEEQINILTEGSDD